MKKLLLIALLILPACAKSLPTLNLSNQVNLNTVEGIVSGYGVLVSAEDALKQTPLCLTGTEPSFTNICVKRSVIVRLQNEDRIANVAVNGMVAFVKTHPNVDPTQYIATARDAILTVQDVYNTAKAGS